MAGNLLKEDNSKILCESGNDLGLARKVDYKFGYIFNHGTTTDCLVRFYEGTGNEDTGNYARSVAFISRLDVHAGSKTIEELRIYYNAELLTLGKPITQQT